MIPWQSRLYAFIFKRALGPLLDDASLELLHTSIQVSLSGGKLVLSDIALNLEYLKRIQATVPSLAIRKARVGRLEVCLTIQESSEENQTSLAWRVMELGTATARGSPGVKLTANVQLDGVILEIEPNYDPVSVVVDPKSSMDTEDSPKGILSSYLEAALSSLRLNVHLNDIQLMISAPSSSQPCACSKTWLKLHIQSLTYRDEEEAVESQSAGSMSSGCRSVTVGKLTAVSGESRNSTPSPSISSTRIALWEGTKSVRVRLYQCTGDRENDPTGYQQDIQVQLNRRLNFFVDETVLSQAECLINAYQKSEAFHGSPSGRKESLQENFEERAGSPPETNPDHENLEDDLCTLDGIMEEFNEARKLAETQMVRGGLLLPSVEDGTVTYDTFFDANDQSLLNYTSVLQNSILGKEVTGSDTNEQRSFVHTKIRLNLVEGSVKLSFGVPRSLTSSRRSNSCDEYILLTFSDLSVSVLVSQLKCEVALSLNHVEIEDAVCSNLGEVSTLRSQVGTILQFRSDGIDPVDAQDALLEAPCISLSLKMTPKSTALEIVFEALVVTHRERTLSNFLKFLQLRPKSKTQPQLESKPFQLFVACPALALRTSAGSESGKHFSPLFQRTDQKVGCGSLYMEVRLEGLSLESTPSSDLKEPVLAIYSHSIIGSALEEPSDSFGPTRRFPVFALAGRSEVNPAIPVAIKVFSQASLSNSEGHGLNFPFVKPINSFKARQEDDDQENKIDRVDSGLGFTGNRDPRRQNPEPVMVANAKDCTSLIEVSVPVLVGDISVDELLLLLEMVSGVNRNGNQMNHDSVSECGETSDSDFAPTTALSVSVARVSVSLHEKDSKAKYFSLSLESTGIRLHAVKESGGIKQFRLVAHDFDVYEGDGLFGSHSPDNVDLLSNLVQRSLSASETARFEPILHRSHLFTPISRESPVLVVDLLSSDVESQFVVHVTVYDLTYRVNYDSEWIGRTTQIVTKCKAGLDDGSSKGTGTISQHMVVRAFLSLADCNVDYQSPLNLLTPCRFVVRIGDLRVSSNLVLPLVSAQAVNSSLGDLSVYLCCERFGYQFEDGCTLVGSLRRSEQHKNTPESVQRDMNYRSIVTLDNADAAFTFSLPDIELEPSVKVSLTLGKLCLFACKDSFSIFIRAICEVVDDLSSLDDVAFGRLRDSNRPRAAASARHLPKRIQRLVSPKKNIGLPGDTETTAWGACSTDFLLDGYDWTTIDSEEQPRSGGVPPGEEQAAKYYYPHIHGTGPTIIPHHFPLQPETDPILSGDMGATRLTGLRLTPNVKGRVIVNDMRAKIRFFDGYDWPELLTQEERNRPRNKSFVIHQHEEQPSEAQEKLESTEGDDGDSRSKLMGNLLEGLDDEPSETFKDVPLAEERGASLRNEAELRKLARRTDKYFQFSANGIKLRMDSMEDSTEHSLASCLYVKAQDFFLAETISSSKPVKMVGEWFNEVDHPRDTNDGLFMLKVVTWHPCVRVLPDDSIANDICEGVMRILPLRCFMDQGAMFFVREFFHNPEGGNDSVSDNRHRFPPPVFRRFRARPFKVKANYTPQRLDRKALRDGSFVELANLSPIDDMVLTMKGIEVEDKTGFGEVMSILVSSWIQDIVRTQLIKFVTNIRPLEPISQVGETAVDMVVLPWEAFKNGESVQKAIRSGTSLFASTFVYEAVEVASRIAEFFATTVGTVSRGSAYQQSLRRSNLPSRPVETPRGVLDTTPHAVESVARGVREANYKIVIVPYREYLRSGTRGAMQSVLRGIPVAISAPTSGAAEAISYSLLGIRNQIRPDIRREEEAVQRGLHHGKKGYH